MAKKQENALIVEFKDKARHLKSMLKHRIPDITHGECLNYLAKLHKARSWNELRARFVQMDSPQDQSRKEE